MTRSFLQCLLIVGMLLLAGVNSEAQWLRKNGPDSDVMLQEARKEIDRRNYVKAIELLRKAIDLSPSNNDIRLVLGKAYFLNHQYDAAHDELVYLVHKQPKYRDAYSYLINLESERRNWANALCFADDGLYNYPGDREFVLKKLEILSHFRDREQANRYADRMLERYTGDTTVFRAYIDARMASALAYKRAGNFARARYDFEQILEHDPANKEALDEIFNIELRSGNYQGSLAFVNRALQTTPNNYSFLLKKVGLLEEMHEYAQAIATLQKIIKFYPNDRIARQLEVDLRMAAGRYYMSMDPYLQFQSVLERSPGNREALDYVINLSYSRGLYQETLRWINQGLRTNPSDATLLNKKVGVLEQLKYYNEAASIAERLWQRGGSRVAKEQFMELKVLSGKLFMGNLQYDSAMAEFQSVLNLQPNHVDALNYSISLATTQKNYEDALRILESALQYYPESDGLQFRKAGILESAGRFSEAATISSELLARYPDNKKYLSAYIDQTLAAGKASMQSEEYERSIAMLKGILAAQPDNEDALNYLINMETAMQRYDSALYYADLALQQHPDSREFLFKKSSVLNEAKQFRDAYKITADLYRQYPYYPKYRQALVEELLASGKQYQNAKKNDSAILEYAMALEVAPRDTTALYYAINVLSDAKQYDTTLGLINKAIAYYPSNSGFWLKKAVTYENMERWQAAAEAMDTFKTLAPGNNSQADYHDYLRSKVLHHEFGMYFLHSSYDYGLRPSNIATLVYTNRGKKSVVNARFSFAGRQAGTGLQAELEAYYHHNPKTYSYVIGSFSNQLVFARMRLGYSLFHTFKDGWEGEIGIRYLKQIDTISAVSFLGSVARGYGDFWFNLRGYYTNFSTGKASSANLLSRYFINGKSDYIQASLGYGTTPDDRSNNFQFERLAKLKTFNIGAGFQKQFKYRTTLGVYGTWYNNQLGQDDDGVGIYQNQYDIYLMLTRKF